MFSRIDDGLRTSTSHVKRKLADRLGDLTSLSRIDQRRPNNEQRAKIVALSKILLEDYVYNRLSQINYMDLGGTPTSPISGGGTAVPRLTPTPSDSGSNQSTPSSPPPQLSLFINKRSSMALNVDFVKYSKWKDRQPEVAVEIQRLGAELETKYPHLYENLSAQLRMPLKSLNSVTKALTFIGDYMFQDGVVNWGRIVGLIAISGAMCLEVLLSDNGRLICHIVETHSQIIDRHAVVFVHNRGGWAGILRPNESSRIFLDRLNCPQWYGRLLGFATTAYIIHRITSFFTPQLI